MVPGGNPLLRYALDCSQTLPGNEGAGNRTAVVWHVIQHQPGTGTALGGKPARHHALPGAQHRNRERSPGNPLSSGGVVPPGEEELG